ncbi:hypothetical protein [Leptothermofonsia sp. ETS-13]|uniref:hypothetical protein n=1 Tax=Leptothermofonsia sp. ETS-13 TaxID=3035696 RepID=UPI003BA31E8B
MNDSQTFSADLQCTLSNLQALSIQNPTTTQLENCEPFQLSVTITFSDTASGHLINLLLPLGLAIRVNFSARSFSGPGPEIDLGYATLTTEAGVLSYTPTLKIEGGPESVGLDSNTIYQIKAIARVGHAPFSIPALGRGFINGLDLPVGTPEVVTELAEEPKAEPEATKTPTTSRTRKSGARSQK